MRIAPLNGLILPHQRCGWFSHVVWSAGTGCGLYMEARQDECAGRQQKVYTAPPSLLSSQRIQIKLELQLPKSPGGAADRSPLRQRWETIQTQNWKPVRATQADYAHEAGRPPRGPQVSFSTGLDVYCLRMPRPTHREEIEIKLRVPGHRRASRPSETPPRPRNHAAHLRIQHAVRHAPAGPKAPRPAHPHPNRAARFEFWKETPKAKTPQPS